jgi:hypothetical protein
METYLINDMSKSNAELAKIIDDKLKAAGLINDTETQLAIKLAKGTLKDVDWKLAFEEVLNKPIATKTETDEAK